MNRIEGILKTISDWVSDIKQGLAEDVRKQSINPKTRMRIGWINDLFEPTLKEERSKLGDCLASEGGARCFTVYISVLTNSGRKEPNPGENGAECLKALKSSCWNFSDVSLNFCYELGKSGLFRILATHLERCKGLLQTAVEKEDFEILSSLSILHNCAKDIRNRDFLKEAKVVEALLPYTRTRNNNLIQTRMIAILAMSYVLEEDTENETVVDKPMLYIIVFFLEKTLESTNHTFNGFSALELVSGLHHLANNDQNKVPIVDTGMLPHLGNLLKSGDEGEKTVSAATLWSLCFADKNKSRILEHGDIVKSLEKLRTRPGELGRVTGGAFWLLKYQASPFASLRRRSGADFQATSASKEKQIMISYSSRQKILALKVKARLEKLNCSVWMDMDGTEGRNFDGAKEAIENSDAVLLCVSHDYKTQPSCRMEAEYARNLSIPLFPILAESNYKTSGWLRETQGSKSCVDFSDPAIFNRSFAMLARDLHGEFGDIVKAKSQPAAAAANPTTAQAAEPSDTSIETWTTTEVMNWATKNNLSKTHFLNVDGESLAYLKDMKKDSPEFYHKYVVENLEISDLQDLKNLSRGLENLKL